MSKSDVDTIRTLAELCTAAGKGKLKYVLFWDTDLGHGAPGPPCLCQWHPSPFVIGGVTYVTAEHWMMAEKARLFGDEESLEKVLVTPSPRAAKAIGRKVRGYSDEAWAARRFDAVVEGNIAKFRQHPPLLDYLLSTRGKLLVEASPTDRIWGIGLDEGHPDAENPLRWRGENLLGFALMEVRSRLAGGAG